MQLQKKICRSFRKGIIACNGAIVSANKQLPAESLQMMDYWYARDYEPAQGFEISYGECTGGLGDEAIDNWQLTIDNHESPFRT